MLYLPGDKFDTFMKNRERLVNVMGLHPNENDGLDGRRSANSMELVKLLKVVKGNFSWPVFVVLCTFLLISRNTLFDYSFILNQNKQ